MHASGMTPLKKQNAKAQSSQDAKVYLLNNGYQALEAYHK